MNDRVPFCVSVEKCGETRRNQNKIIITIRPSMTDGASRSPRVVSSGDVVHHFDGSLPAKPTGNN